MECEAQLRVHERRIVGQHVTGKTKFVVACGAQEVHLPTGFTHQYIGAGNIGSAR